VPTPPKEILWKMRKQEKKCRLLIGSLFLFKKNEGGKLGW